jgi:hypothetical protein
VNPELDEPGANSTLGRAIKVLRQPVELGERPFAGALAELSREHRPRWWSRPVLVGLALAATLAVLVTTSVRRERPVPAPSRAVRFVLRTPASRVMLIGDFNDWDPAATPLSRTDGEWSTTLALRPGRYRYAFLLDGSRLEADPAGPVAADEFGGSTSAVTVSN